MKHITINLLKNTFTIFTVSALLFITYPLAFAQEIPSVDEDTAVTEPDSNAEEMPYELGVILIQYDETLFSAPVNEEEGEDTEIPGGLVDNVDTTTVPVGVADTFLKANGVADPRVIERIESFNVEVIDIGEGVDPVTVIQKLKANPVDGIVLAQPNFIYRSAQSPGLDPRRNESWHLKAIQLKDAWDFVEGTAPTSPTTVTVGVIDTGTDFSNVDLVNTKWNPTSCKDENGNVVRGGCPNGGYDVHGIIHDRNPSPRSDDRHGTLVASVLAGEYNNGFGGMGVAQNIQVVGIRAGIDSGFFREWYRTTFRTQDIIEATNFARENQVDVINLSLGLYIDPSSCNDFKYVGTGTTEEDGFFLEYRALKAYGQKTQQWGGGVAVIAAGNKYEQTGGGADRRVVFPADFSSTVTVKGESTPCWEGLPNIISVGGTELTQNGLGGSEKLFEVFASPGQRHLDEDGDPAGTAYGNHIDITAPARAIPIGRKNTAEENMVPSSEGRRRDSFGGTSHAAPQVAGVAALMLRVNPSLTPAQIKRMIRDSADEVDSLRVGNLAGGRRLNAYRAVLAARGIATEQPSTLPIIPALGSNADYLTSSPTALLPFEPAQVFSAPGNENLVISWDAVSNATSYEIRWRAEGQKAPQPWNWTDIGAVTGHTITNLTNGVKYAVQVRAKNSIGVGEKAGIGFGKSTKPTSSLPAPSRIFSTTGDQSLAISWNAVSNATSYEIRWRAEGQKAPRPWNWTDIGAVTSHTITNLTNGVKYAVQVRARSNVAVSEKVSIDFGKSTKPISSLPAPATVISKPGNQRLTISWSPVPGAVTYGIRYRDPGSEWSDDTRWINVTGSSTKYIITGLTNGTQYVVQVRTGGRSGMVSDEETAISGTSTIPTTATAPPSGGTDSNSNGLIEIATVEQLQNIHHSIGTHGYRDGPNAPILTTGCPEADHDDNPVTPEIRQCTGFELVSDIDLAGVTWIPIGTSEQPFDLTFDGNNHAISNLSISTTPTTELEYIGFFGYIQDASIRNLRLSKVNITAQYPLRGVIRDDGISVGGLVGYSDDSTITNTHATGSVAGVGESGTGYFASIGGLVGFVLDSLVTSASFVGSVSGDAFIGGLSGENNGSTITNSYVAGSVYGNNKLGGLLGRNYQGVISNSYAVSSVSHSDFEGSFVGALIGNNRLNEMVANSYYIKGIGPENEFGEGRTFTQLREGTPSTDIFTGWSTAVWDFGTTDQLPILRGSGVIPVTPRSDDADKDGLIEIATVADLQSIREKLGTECPSANCNGFELIANIDLAGITWDPLAAADGGPFGVIFDGNNHTISNLSVSASAQEDFNDKIGFFRGIEYATIKNLGLLNVNLIEDVGSYGAAVGGIAGFSYGSSITNSYVTGSISGHSNVGGLVGRGHGGTVTNSYVATLISGENDRWVGGLVGNSGVPVTTSYYNKDLDRSIDRSGVDEIGVGKTFVELREGTPSADIFTGWDTAIWDFGITDQLPILRGSGVTPASARSDDTDKDGLIDITSAADLQSIHQKLGTECPSANCSGFELGSNVDMAGMPWTPLGTLSKPFSLVFDGNNHTISNLTFQDSNRDYAGFFGHTRYATVKNLGLTDVTFTGNDHVGGLIGRSDHDIVRNSYATGSVSGNNNVGGLIGFCNGLYGRHSNFEEVITGSHTTTSASGDYSVGGLVGKNFGCEITNSYTTGATESASQSDRHGGYIGGLVGRNNGGIRNSYAIGPISGKNFTGGLIGRNSGRRTPTNSYWDRETTGRTFSSGTPDSFGKTTAEMQSGIPGPSIYTDWDTSIWDFGTSAEYPVLK